jgi:RHS repeat-associated protein
LGSTRLLTNSDGTVSDRYNYDAYGVLLTHAGTNNNSFLFAGEQRDSATGLDYLRARYYDPDLGRFISKDPFSGFITDPMSQHDYQYAHANPVRFTDPTGYFSLGEMGAVMAALGTLSSMAWSAAYIITDENVMAEDVYGLYGQWGLGFAQGISGGAITDIYSDLTGETIKPKNDFMWQMGFMAGASILMGAGFGVAGGVSTKVGIGVASWVAFTDGYAAGKGILGLSDGKWEWNDVWNLLSLLPIAGPLLGSASKGITAMRAASRGGGVIASAANTAGKQINRVAHELTEVTTKVETGGTPAPTVVPDPIPGRSNDPIPTTPDQPKNCFIAGTDILTPEGMKDIETIQVGDLVIADDPNTLGEVEARRVVETYIRQVTTLIDLYIDGQIITTTEEHPFWVPDLGWVEAKDLQEGTLVQTNHETFLDIDKIERREGDFTVYNFQVEEFHSYFVSDLGILVHNNNYLDDDIWNDDPLNQPVRDPVGDAVNHIMNDHPERLEALGLYGAGDLQNLLDNLYQNGDVWIRPDNGTLAYVDPATGTVYIDNPARPTVFIPDRPYADYLVDHDFIPR